MHLAATSNGLVELEPFYRMSCAMDYPTQDFLNAVRTTWTTMLSRAYLTSAFDGEQETFTAFVNGG